MTAQGAIGHFEAMAALGASLTARGHEVTVATSPGFSEFVRSCGFPAVAVGREWSSKDLRATWPEFAEVPVEQRNAWVNEEMWGYRLPAPMVPDLLRLAYEHQPDVIVSGRAEIAGPLVSELLGIPHFVVSAGRAIGLRKFVREVRPGRSRLRVELNLPPDPDGDRWFSAPYLNQIPREFLPDADDGWPVRFDMRPTSFNFGWPPPALPDPPDGRPLVYLTMGANQGGMLVERFVLLISAALKAGACVLAATGDTEVTRAVDSNDARLRVVDFAPQPFVFARAALTICHGGVNTTLGSLVAGVPLLLVPTEQSDQDWNAQRSASLQVGRVLSREGLTQHAAAEAIAAMLAGGPWSANARRYSEELSALPTPAEGAAMIESHVQRGELPRTLGVTGLRR